MYKKPDIYSVPTISNINIQQYERYNPTAFNDSLTILEKINKVIYQLNNLGEISNDLSNQWNVMVEWILGNGLNDVVSEEIDKRIEDGTFNNLFISIIGNLENLETINKETIVSAINEINKISNKNNDDIGEIGDLKTINKNNIVDAINEILVQVLKNKNAPMSVGEATGYGVISGFKVTQQNSLAMAIEVGESSIPNIIHMKDGTRYHLDSKTIAISESSNTLDRKDVIYVSEEGVISYKEGIPSINPSPPQISIGSQLLAEITVVKNDTTVNNSDITDKREIKNLDYLKTSNKSNFVVAINEVIKMIIDSVKDINAELGDKSKLNVFDKSSFVNAINEVIGDLLTLKSNLELEIGDLINLNSNDKTSVVNSINSIIKDIDDRVVSINNKIDGNYDVLSVLIQNTNNDLNSSLQLEVNALMLMITEISSKLVSLKNEVGDLTQLETSEKTSIVSAINEIYISFGQSLNEQVEILKNSIGKNSDLTTDDKTTVVNAINELNKIIKGKISTKEINVLEFGAIADNTTDNKPYFEALCNFVNSITDYIPVVIFPVGNYMYSDGLYFKREVVIKGEGALNYKGNGIALKMGKDNLTYDDIDNNIVYEIIGLTFTGGENMIHGVYFNEWVIGPKLLGVKFIDFGNPNAYTVFYQYNNWDIIVMNCEWYIRPRNHPSSKVLKVNARSKVGNKSDNGQSHFKAINCYHNTFSVFQNEGFILNCFNPQVLSCTISGSVPAIRIGEYGNSAQILDSYFETLQGDSTIQYGADATSPNNGDYISDLQVQNCYANVHNTDGIGDPNTVFIAPTTSLAGLTLSSIRNNSISGSKDGQPLVKQNDLLSQIGNVADGNTGTTFIHNDGDRISSWLGWQGSPEFHNKSNRPTYLSIKSGVTQNQSVGVILKDFDESQLFMLDTSKAIGGVDFYVKNIHSMRLGEDGSVTSNGGLLGIGKQIPFGLTGLGQIFEDTSGKLMYRSTQNKLYELTTEFTP